MKAIIFDIKRFAVHDGPGIRTTVFFKGCPLHCLWCHNPEGISNAPEIQFIRGKCINCRTCQQVCFNKAHLFNDGEHHLDRDKCTLCGICVENCTEEALQLCGKSLTVSQVMDVVLQDKAFYDYSGGGVTLSGGECLIQADFCVALLQKLKENNINTAVDTSGYVPRKVLSKVIPYTDLFLYDIKHIDPEKHKYYTGVDNAQIIENLKYLNEQKKLVEIRIPIIPTVNDDDKTINDIGNLLSKQSCIQSVRILAYNNLASSKYEMIGRNSTQPKVTPLDDSKMRSIQSTLELYGLNVVY